jgi:hypothetical protein
MPAQAAVAATIMALSARRSAPVSTLDIPESPSVEWEKE